jgi:hypothetical protein
MKCKNCHYLVDNRNDCFCELYKKQVKNVEIIQSFCDSYLDAEGSMVDK